MAGIAGAIPTIGEHRLGLLGPMPVLAHEVSAASPDLTILPKQDLVQTNGPVVIRQAPNTIIQATGMVFDKKKQTLTLLHRVRAHYEKASRAPKPSKPLIPKAAKNSGSKL